MTGVSHRAGKPAAGRAGSPLVTDEERQQWAIARWKDACALALAAPNDRALRAAALARWEEAAAIMDKRDADRLAGNAR